MRWNETCRFIFLQASVVAIATAPAVSAAKGAEGDLRQLIERLHVATDFAEVDDVVNNLVLLPSIDTVEALLSRLEAEIEKPQDQRIDLQVFHALIEAIAQVGNSSTYDSYRTLRIRLSDRLETEVARHNRSEELGRFDRVATKLQGQSQSLPRLGTLKSETTHLIEPWKGTLKTISELYGSNRSHLIWRWSDWFESFVGENYTDDSIQRIREKAPPIQAISEKAVRTIASALSRTRQSDLLVVSAYNENSDELMRRVSDAMVSDEVAARGHLKPASAVPIILKPSSNAFMSNKHYWSSSDLFRKRFKIFIKGLAKVSGRTIFIHLGELKDYIGSPFLPDSPWAENVKFIVTSKLASHSSSTPGWSRIILDEPERDEVISYFQSVEVPRLRAQLTDFDDYSPLAGVHPKALEALFKRASREVSDSSSVPKKMLQDLEKIVDRVIRDPERSGTSITIEDVWQVLGKRAGEEREFSSDTTRLGRLASTSTPAEFQEHEIVPPPAPAVPATNLLAELDPSFIRTVVGYWSAAILLNFEDLRVTDEDGMWATLTSDQSASKQTISHYIRAAIIGLAGDQATVVYRGLLNTESSSRIQIGILLDQVLKNAQFPSLVLYRSAERLHHLKGFLFVALGFAAESFVHWAAELPGLTDFLKGLKERQLELTDDTLLHMKTTLDRGQIPSTSILLMTALKRGFERTLTYSSRDDKEMDQRFVEDILHAMRNEIRHTLPQDPVLIRFPDVECGSLLAVPKRGLL